MAQLSEHPTVKRFYEQNSGHGILQGPAILDAAWLRQVCLESGADDAGFVDITNMAEQKAEILAAFPDTKTVISVVCRMNRENIRTPARSIANVEFHHTTDKWMKWRGRLCPP